jgi:hypothetical protein
VTLSEHIQKQLEAAVLDDSAYAKERLGRVPSKREVEEAAAYVTPRCVEDFIEWLAPYESDVWQLLEGEPRERSRPRHA